MTDENNIIAIDFETFYSAEYSVKKLGPWGYAHDPRFDCYQVAVKGPDLEWVGHPKDFDWSLLTGKTLIAHNASFDKAIFSRLQELGDIPISCVPREWLCTSALAAYCQCPGDLAGATKAILAYELSKDERTAAKGKHGRSLDTPAMREYGLGDVRACLGIWQTASKYWPEHERDVYRITLQMGEYGICIDQEALASRIKQMEDRLATVKADIPWASNGTPTSPKCAQEFCKMHGIAMPKSLAKDNATTNEWLQWDAPTEVATVIHAIRSYKRVNRMLKLLEKFAARIRPDGTIDAHVRYFGAFTGRWSGGGNGLNLQNLNNGELEDDQDTVDLRGLVIPRPGKKLLAIDLAQIEARFLLWFVGDTTALELCKEYSVYEAHARATMGWTGGKLKDEDPNLYKLAKARVLGCGYGAGTEKLMVIAKKIARLELSHKEADDAKHAYRKSNPAVVSKWYEMMDDFKAHLNGTHKVALPSGRTLLYRNVRNVADENDKPAFMAEQVKGESSYIWHGVLIENAIQALARDYFADRLVALVRSDFQPVMLIHDEYVLEVPEDRAAIELDLAEHIICHPLEVPWCRDIPIGVEGAILNRYE